MNVACVLSAIFFFTGNLLMLIFYGKERGRDHFDRDTYMTLDPSYIQAEWDFRLEHRAKYFSAGVINSLAWFFFCFPLVQLAWILSQRGSKNLGLHVGIALLAIAGSFTEYIARFLYIGSSMATALIVREFNLDNWVGTNSNDQIGWRALEVTHIVVRGLILLIDAFEWIAVFLIMVLVHVSVRKWRVHDTTTFGIGWNSLGLFIGLLALLDFVAEVLRMDGFRIFGRVAFWYAAVNRLVLLPGWLLVLGWRLPYAAMTLNSNEDMIDAQRQSTVN